MDTTKEQLSELISKLSGGEKNSFSRMKAA